MFVLVAITVVTIVALLWLVKRLDKVAVCRLLVVVLLPFTLLVTTTVQEFLLPLLLLTAVLFLHDLPKKQSGEQTDVP